VSEERAEIPTAEELRLAPESIEALARRVAELIDSSG
jgi:hypothetical protein